MQNNQKQIDVFPDANGNISVPLEQGTSYRIHFGEQTFFDRHHNTIQNIVIGYCILVVIYWIILFGSRYKFSISKQTN